MEDTPITDRNKLSTLCAILTLAVALYVKTGVTMARFKPVSVKKHGGRVLPLFARRLDTLRKLSAIVTRDQFIVFFNQLISPNLLLKPLLNIAF
jgi:hypothetical protein